MKKKNKILVTGSCGFIGFHVAKKLLENNYQVFGIDNLNEYYSTELKKKRNSLLLKFKNYKFNKIDICKKNYLFNYFKKKKFDYVIHLAAQAGVRHSIFNPDIYINSNLVGFFNVIDCSRIFKIKHFVYASSSSVYGLNKKKIFLETDNTDHPSSLYGATKKSNEIIAHSYSQIYKLPTTGLRFFTVYGPYGRPDMSLYIFTKAIFEKKKFNIFNYGKMKRSFTYIDDIVNSVCKLIFYPPRNNLNKRIISGTSTAPYEIYNLGNPKDIKLLNYVSILESIIGIKGKKKLTKIQAGDVMSTKADISKLRKKFKIMFKVQIFNGIKKFTEWYKFFNKI